MCCEMAVLRALRWVVVRLLSRFMCVVVLGVGVWVFWLRGIGEVWCSVMDIVCLSVVVTVLSLLMIVRCAVAFGSSACLVGFSRMRFSRVRCW